MSNSDSFEKILMLGTIEAGGEGDNRGWNDWMASLTRQTWVWVNSGSWWWTGRPGVLQSMGSKRVGHDWATELNWTELRPWASQLAQWWRIHLTIRRCGFKPWVRKILWRRKWQPNPVFLPRKLHGQRSLEGSQRVRHDLAAKPQQHDQSEHVQAAPRVWEGECIMRGTET